MPDKKTLSERDICTKYITPALEKAGWNKQTQLLEFELSAVYQDVRHRLIIKAFFHNH